MQQSLAIFLYRKFAEASFENICPMKLPKNITCLLKKSENMEKRFVFFCALVGAVAGLLSVGFRLAIEGLFSFIWNFGGVLGEENRFWLMPLMPAFGGLIVGVCVSSFAKSASGSGIPQTKAAYYNNFGLLKWRDAVQRFVLGAIFCGFGNSAGREGPTVHLCASAASAMAQNFGFPKQLIRESVPAGMGAGIAASFNAPLSAISFVFEELLGGFGKARRVGGLIISVVVAAAVSRIILGENPVLPVGVEEFHTGWWMAIALPIAVFAGLAGNAFLKILLKFRAFARGKIHLPFCLIAALGGLIVGAIAISCYYFTGYNSVFSVGYGVLIPAFGGAVCLKAMFMIFVLKFIATIINYSMGGSGGLFSPTLVIGGMMGGAVGMSVCLVFGADKSLVGACVLLGMGACFASIIRCPITSILMIFELTLNYSLILPLLFSNLLAYAIACKLHPVGLYDSLLLQDGITLRKMPVAKNNRDWEALPISTIMSFNPVCVCSSDLAAEILSVLKKRGAAFKSYPVLDANSDFIGMVSLEDLRKNADSGKKCGEFMVRGREGNFLYAGDTISAAARHFCSSEFYDAAIVDAGNPKKVVGILTIHDIARCAVDS